QQEDNRGWSDSCNRSSAGGQAVNIGARIVIYTIVTTLLSTLIPGTVLWASDERVIRIAGDNNFPPFEYISESGSYTGFNIDVLNAISIETGLKIELVPMSWNQALKALENGEVDAIQGM